MIVYSRDLPSKGVGTSIDQYELHPLNFKELMDYVGNDEFTKLRYYIKDLRILLKQQDKIGSASIIDADYLIYLMKVLTISDEVKFTYSYKCKCCGQRVSGSISSTNLVFREIDPRYFTLYKINIGGVDLYWHQVTIEEFIDYTAKLPRNMEFPDLKLIKLASMFTSDQTPIQKVLEIFHNATGDDIKTLLFVKAAYFDVVKPVTLKCEKGGETVVGLNDLTTDMFHLLLQNRRLDPSKIHFKQIPSTD